MIRISSFIALLMFTSASYAKDRDCDGTYNVYFDSHKVEYRKERGISAWIPATIEVRGALRQCVNTLSLKPLRSNQIVLKGPGYSLEGQLMDDGYRALNSAHGGRYLLPLSSSGTTQFWLRLPSAGFSPAGSYEARLQTKFLDEKLAPTRNVDINYVSVPVVSMRVPSTSELGYLRVAITTALIWVR
ncbi:hypothetical protein JCM19233_1816 [Vibrio astriarenae]|nr:hypothetical protein JCM19233_1816 [Vibrio sp. C7]